MRFLLLAWFLLSVSSLVFAEPPIEVIYFKPSDVKAPTQDELDFLGDAMVKVQSFFASEMERYGFGPKTFAFNPDITVIKGKRKVADYTQDGMLVNESSLIEGGLDNQIHVVFLGGAETFMGAAGLSRGLCNAPPDQWIFCNNLVVVPTGIPDILLPVLAHEIAHAFYILEHSSERLTENRIDVMHVLVVTPGVKEELGKYAFNPVDATLLNEGGRLAVQDGLNIDSVTPDLVAYYPFDGNTEDASGNGNNGGERGAVEYVEGKFGDAIGLDSGVYVLVPPLTHYTVIFLKETRSHFRFGFIRKLEQVMGTFGGVYRGKTLVIPYLLLRMQALSLGVDGSMVYGPGEISAKLMPVSLKPIHGYM